MKLYTKTGDAGETALFGGKRVSKSDGRIDTYGEVDELNAVIGLAISLLPTSLSSLSSPLLQIQNRLFSVGAILANLDGVHSGKNKIDSSDIEALEHLIDEWDKVLPPLKTFILPGGSQTGATLHLARTVCRRVERKVVSLSQNTSVPPIIVTYLNRLSDFLFAAARFANHTLHISEHPW